MRTKFKLGQMLEVTWDDATGDSSWFTRKEFEMPIMRCRTVGYYLEQDPRAIVLVNSLFDDYEKLDGTVGGYTTIPKGMIIEIRKIDVDG